MPLMKVRRKLEKREKERVKSRLGAVVKVIKFETIKKAFKSRKYY